MDFDICHFTIKKTKVKSFEAFKILIMKLHKKKVEEADKRRRDIMPFNSKDVQILILWLDFVKI